MLIVTLIIKFNDFRVSNFQTQKENKDKIKAKLSLLLFISKL